MARAFQLERSVSCDDRFYGAGHQREACAGLNHVERRCHFDRPFELVGPCAEGVRQREQDAPDLFYLLLFQRNDLVVDLDGLERLDEQARAAGRAAMNDSGNRRSMFGANHQHMTAVAIGDDLLLEIFRGLAAAQERVERRTKALLLPAQAIANLRERGARVVRDISRRLDLPADVGDLAGERRYRIDLLAEDRKRGAHPSDRLSRLLDRLEIVAELQQSKRFERAAIDGERFEDRVEIRRCSQWKSRVIRQEPGAFRRCPLQRDDARGIDGRSQLRQPVLACGGDGKAGHDADNAIELESPQGARMHG